MTDTTGRRYAGRDQATRRRARREQLMSAGLDLFAARGYTRVSVKQVCDAAGLTQRYFYESFGTVRTCCSAGTTRSWRIRALG